MRIEIGLAALAGALACACSAGDGGSGSGKISLEVTDKPLSHDLVESAVVHIDRITTHVSGGAKDDADGGWVTLYEDDPADGLLELDLLDLQGGVTASLVNQRSLPAGKYRQLRLRIASATLTMKSGDVFTTEDGTLNPASTDDSGFKLFLDPPLQIVDGASRSLLLDFDLSKTFSPVPNGDPENATSFNLHPVIHVTNLSKAGELRGDVHDAEAAPVAEATVYVMEEGETDIENALRSTGSMADGTFVLLGVDPGTYDLIAVKDSTSGTDLGVLVTVGGVTVSSIEVQ